MREERRRVLLSSLIPHPSSLSSYVRLEQAVQHAFDGPRQIIRLLVERNAERQRQRVAQGGADQLPGPDARVERAAEDAGLLALADHLGQERLAVEIKRAQEVRDLAIVGLDQGPVH